MSVIVKYSFDQSKEFISKVEEYYQKTLTEGLTFEDWKCMAYPNMLNNPKRFGVIPVQLHQEICVAPSGIDMLKIIKEHEKELLEIEQKPHEQWDMLKTAVMKRVLKPIHRITLENYPTVPGVMDGKQMDIPVWFNTTYNQVNIRLGFEKLDSSKPSSMPLGDSVVHMLLGGRTGAGKSVALNDIICSLLLEYPPWELELVLADFKIVELSRYANRIPTPHVKIVAATGSLEFALSTFAYMVQEMNARQEVFTACGVNNIKEFRDKFHMVMPRIVLIADEFVQMYANVKTAQQNGNDKADELKQQINKALSDMARLGRSMGLHMLLSSQNMDGVLDDQTASQFGAGATLAATPSVSKTLIGNTAGATIRGKGKAYFNLHKSEQNIADNVLVRVPYIVSDVSDEEASKGKLSYLQELLKQMYDIAESVGWKNIPYYYNENNAVHKKQYYEALAECIEYVLNPNEGSDLANDIYKKTAFARVPLGREIAYTQEKAYSITVRYKQYNNLLIHADDKLIKINIAKLIGESLSYYASKFVIAMGDEVTMQECDVREYAEAQHIPVEVDRTGVIPARYIGLVATRQKYLDLQNLLLSKNDSGKWEPRYVYEFASKLLKGGNNIELSELIDRLLEKFPDLEDMPAQEQLEELFQDLDGINQEFVRGLIGEYVTLRKTFAKLTKGFTEALGPKSFEPIVIWWMGAEQLKGIKDYDIRTALTAFLSSSCQVGIFNVLIPALRCDNLGDYALNCNFILENCSKEFFLSVGLPRHININKNSYGAHDRELKINKFIRTYS